MYTDTAEMEKEFIEEENNNNNRKGLIIKIIIIVICLIILTWLIIALKNANNKKPAYDPMVRANNIEEVRLASEKYFFINKNLPTSNSTKSITLSELKNKKLVKEIVDYNKKTCSDDSVVKLTDDGSTYVLRINLVCTDNENEEVFYYDKKTGACLNCNGKTLMTGQTSQEENVVVPVVYNCKTWSSWSSKKENDLSLEEKTRSLYRGVKEENFIERVSYSEWSEYSKNPVSPTTTKEVETKQNVESTWSDTKTTSKDILVDDKIRIVKTESESYSYCPSDYKRVDNKCVSTKLVDKYVTPSEYIHLRDAGISCGKPFMPDDYSSVYVYHCSYYPTTSLKTGTRTIYYYQERTDTVITYYRYRTKKIEKVALDTTYTEDYYEEGKIPSGYKKAVNTLKLEYSYKLKECEK